MVRFRVLLAGAVVVGEKRTEEMRIDFVGRATLSA